MSGAACCIGGGSEAGLSAVDPLLDLWMRCPPPMHPLSRWPMRAVPDPMMDPLTLVCAAYVVVFGAAVVGIIITEWWQ